MGLGSVGIKRQEEVEEGEGTASYPDNEAKRTLRTHKYAVRTYFYNVGRGAGRI